MIRLGMNQQGLVQMNLAIQFWALNRLALLEQLLIFMGLLMLILGLE
jgi:hypothetical protein